jgi:formylglycine-generating enzyme required for sulfatase activity
MKAIKYGWDADSALEMVLVEGTHGRPFLFGEGDARRPVEVAAFFMATVPVTTSLWAQVMDPRVASGDQRPKEHVSWDEITGPDGFLDRVDATGILAAISRCSYLCSAGTNR